MREKIRNFLNDPLCRIGFLGSNFLVVGQFIFISLKFSSLPKEVPLFYSLPWGSQQLAPLHALFLLPACSLLILIANSFLALVTFNSDFFLARFFFLSSVLVSFLSLFGLLRIVLLLI